MVRNHTVKEASRLNIGVSFVANKKIGCDYSPFNMIVCSNEKDAADNYILLNAKQNDLVITRDIVFAAKLVEKNIVCINDRGTTFNKDNIKTLLSNRDFDLQLAQMGLSKHFNEGYDKKKFESFANSFDKAIHQLLKN
jgi:uncharacterized protein YaiI (UPF0178 family)